MQKKKIKNFVPPNMRQQVSKLSLEEVSSSALVFFDTETTGFGNATAEIIQISAKCQSRNFDCFVKPRRGIKSRITELTGISMLRGIMYHRNIPVASRDTKTSLIDFMDYLESLQQGKVILVAHNAKFDMRILRNALEANSLSERFHQVCVGFICTMSLAAAKIPKSPKGPVNHKMSGLLEFYFGKVEIQLHDAALDVLALESIFQCMQESFGELLPHSYNLYDYWMHQQTVSRARGIKLKLQSLQRFFIDESHQISSKRTIFLI